MQCLKRDSSSRGANDALKGLRVKFDICRAHIRRHAFVCKRVAQILCCMLASMAAVAATSVPDSMDERIRACTACHGEEGRATSDGYYPRIAGKPAGYLYNQLVNFRDGRRRNPMMTYLVSNLPDAYLREIAEHFSKLHPPYPAPAAASIAPSVLERGRELATRGDAGRNIPACRACHGDALTGVEPAVPGLIGLPRDYMSSQFGAWRIGARHAAAPDCMAELTRRMSADDVSAVAAYLASIPVPANATPAAALKTRPPLDCGSFAGANR
jgi:cytochrome c553